MNDLIVKDVPFCGTELLAVQQKENGKIYVGINSILSELGFNEKQVEYRRDKWTQDKVIGKGTLKFSGTLLGAKTGKDVYCMEIKRLPLALAKIEITPKMEKEMPELSEKLEKYQDECADVLAEAFLPQAHNVEKLTIDSREIAKITGKMHCSVMKEIECCMLTMQGMGFIDEEFFQKASYIGANNQWNTMYKCTEQGCEWFSRQLEPEKRKSFLEEITDRFERMRNVLEGKPVKKMPKAVCPAAVLKGRIFRSKNRLYFCFFISFMVKSEKKFFTKEILQ